ncbi:Protein of unknown function [Pyronema omphalodes CBS 100304]|uniref:Uncharacterized protein n=1 Tax=Pyronema omphalodes (strain CBS 100304) TaxID=1076935 RepID=U4LHR7_PYROM|nr:Protein of unknown function [Pyronema omphalodes CBS 100304]
MTMETMLWCVVSWRDMLKKLHVLWAVIPRADNYNHFHSKQIECSTASAFTENHRF